MRLLIITQKVNIDDPILGFFHRWIAEFAKHCEKVTVICLEKGKYNLPENVKVLSLGKERGNTKFDQLCWFYQYVWDERNNYDTVFVHMNPEYVLLGGPFWKLFKKKLSLWYVHKQINPKLWLAEKLTDLIFTSAPESFGLGSQKVHYVGHGINTDIFTPGSHNDGSRTLVHVGRVTPIKHCHTLIEALFLLRENDPKWQAVFIGEPVTPSDNGYKESLVAQVKEFDLNSSVEFASSLPPSQIHKKFQEGFASVNMTPLGGMDKAVLESWASGCPAFTSNPVFTSVLGKHTATFLFELGNPRDLAQKIESYTNLKSKEKIKSELSKKVAAEYSVKAVVDKITNLLNA